MPWLKRVQARFAGQPLVMIGVHTPEFFYERQKRAVAAEARKHGLDYPQLVDADGEYWNAAGNRAWPAVYLVDQQGRIAARYTGTIYLDEHRGFAIEEEIAQLLARGQ